MTATVLLLVLGFGIPFIYFYVTKNPQFGASLTKEEKTELKKSQHWKKGRFQNLEKTSMDITLSSIPGLIRENIKGKKNRNPGQDIPIYPFDADLFGKDGTPKFIWYGHAVLLLQLSDINLLIDPMFGPDASPVGPIRTGRFSRDSLEIMKTLPPVELILLTHDHYDHLDFESIRHFRNGSERFLVPLGVGRHLINWGIPPDRISELGWWEKFEYAGLKLVFTPSRHFSGRGLFDRAKSLWGGWAIKSEAHNIYWSGDGGYGEHFKLIGDQLGPFDWGFMECGQYNERWHQIHMYPEESVKASQDAGVKMSIPFHWGAFSLAMHHWKDPVERFVNEAKAKEQDYLCPEPGQLIVMGRESSYPWWEAIK